MQAGTYGKLNFQYTTEVLTQHYDAFADFLLLVAAELLQESGAPETALDQCRALLDFGKSIRVEVTNDFELVDSRKNSFSYGFLAWRESGRDKPPPGAGADAPFEFEFFLAPTQRDNLLRQLRLYRSDSVANMIRVMSVYINPDDLFDRVRRAA